jgi:hypothetical protein
MRKSSDIAMLDTSAVLWRHRNNIMKLTDIESP